MEEKTNQASGSRLLYYVTGTFILATILLIYLGFFDSFDNRWRDQMFRWRGMEKGDKRITVIAIDDESINKVGQYPWPRRIYPRLLDNLFSLGVRTVGLDILFLNPSPSHDDDMALVNSAAKWSNRVVWSVQMDPEFKDRHYVFNYPFPPLKKVVKHMGLVDQMSIDNDGVVRTTYLMVGASLDRNLWVNEQSRMPSFGLELVSLFQGKPPQDYVKERNFVRLNIRGQEDRTVDTVLQKDGTFRNIVDSVLGIPRIPAWKIIYKARLTDKERDALNGGIVLVGSTAKGAFDHFPSPFFELAPGVEVHANVIDNLLNNRDFAAASDLIAALIVVFFALFAAWIAAFNPLVATSALVGVLLIWSGMNFLFFKHLILLDYSAPTLALVGPFVILFVRKTLAEQQEKRFIKQTFGQYLAPEVVEQLVKEGGVRLGGVKKDLSVLFLDIAHFTNISEKLSPEALIDFLNFYLTGLTDVIHKYKGTVDKYIGDCVMAFWNAPIDNPSHRADACRAAVECILTIERLNKEYKGVDGKGIDGLAEKPAVRIGLNSGDIVVGNTGSAQKKNYTVIGDDVNLASRLEGANKFFGSRIMVSEACYTGAKDAVEGRYLGSIRVIGKEVPIKVFEPIAMKGQLSEEWRKTLALYNDGIQKFYEAMEFARKNEESKSHETFAAAKEKFLAALKITPKDGPSKLYLNMCEDYANILPPPPRDGVINMTSK